MKKNNKVSITLASMMLFTSLVLAGSIQISAFSDESPLEFEIIDLEDIPEIMLEYFTDEEIDNIMEGVSAVETYSEFHDHMDDQRSNLLQRNYGGSFIDENNELNVLFTNLDFIELVLDEWEDIEFSEAIFPHSVLEQTLNEVSELMILGNFDITTASISEIDNHVEIEVLGLSENKMADITNLLTNPNTVVFSESQGEDTPVTTMRGGQRITFSSGGSCSVGFRARRGNTRGFITAGHCTTTTNVGVNFNGSRIGTLTHRRFSGNADAAFVALNSGVTVENQGQGSSTRYGSANSNVIVTGMPTIMFGFQSGAVWSTVRTASTSITMSGVTLTNQFRLRNNSIAGDSGGLIIGFQNDVTPFAIGITVSSNASLGAGATRANNALSAVGATN